MYRVFSWLTSWIRTAGTFPRGRHHKGCVQPCSVAPSGDYDLEAATPAPCIVWLQEGAFADKPDLLPRWPSGRDHGSGGMGRAQATSCPGTHPHLPWPVRSGIPWCQLTSLAVPFSPLCAGQRDRAEGALGQESGDKCPRSIKHLNIKKWNDKNTRAKHGQILFELQSAEGIYNYGLECRSHKTKPSIFDPINTYIYMFFFFSLHGKKKSQRWKEKTWKNFCNSWH